MNGSVSIDVPRLIRVATMLVTIFAGSLVYVVYQPRVQSLQYRIDDAEAQLRSDGIAASEMPHLRAERDALAARYARLFSQNAEAIFLREMLSVVRARRLTLVTTSLARTSETRRDNPRELFSPTHGTLELRGSYRDLLIAIAELSAGSEIVAVEPPNFRRDGTAVVASVPVTIYEPAHAAASPP